MEPKIWADYFVRRQIPKDTNINGTSLAIPVYTIMSNCYIDGRDVKDYKLSTGKNYEFSTEKAVSCSMDISLDGGKTSEPKVASSTATICGWTDLN